MKSTRESIPPRAAAMTAQAEQKPKHLFVLLGLILILLQCLIFSRSILAQPGNQLVLPGLANTNGANGTRFESTVWLTNLGTSATTVELGFIPFQGVAAPVPVTLPAGKGETLRFNNILGSLFGLEGTAGALTARSSQAFDLRGVTANVADPTGTFGLSLRSVSATNLLSPGQTGHSIWLSHGTNPSRGYRTNVAVVLTAPNSSVMVSVYDEANNLRGSTVVSSAAPASWQSSTAGLVAGPEIDFGRVEFQVLSGQATGYTAVVDNVTGDGIVVQAERAVSGPSDLLLNGVVRTPGANGTRFVTDIRLFNPSTTPLIVTIDALGFSGAAQSISRPLPARGLVEIQEILGPNGFNLPDGIAGALRFRASGKLLAAGRTNNVNSSGSAGTFSTFQYALRYDSGFIADGQSGTLIGLNQTSQIPGFRSNLAFFSGPRGAAASLRLSDQFGQELGRANLDMNAHEWRQQRITGWFGTDFIPESARVDILVSRGSLDAYAAVVDNSTGDGVVVPFIPLQAASSGLQISSLTPSTAIVGQTVTLTINGNALEGTTAIRITPSEGITIGNLNSTSTQVTAQLSISPTAQPGTRLVSVTTAAGDSNSLALTVSRPATATRLAFSSVPATVAAGNPFSLTVQGLRDDGSLDSNFSGTVSLAIATGGGTLSGTLSVSAVSGSAIFENASLSSAGTYTLTATSGSLTAAVSTHISVTGGASSVLKVGTFRSQNGYTTEGSLQVVRNGDGTETLRLNPDFRVSSGAGTISIWLARSSGALNASQSLRIGTLTTRFSGEFEFVIPEPGSSGYTHAITYCDGFKINFGFAELRDP